MTAKKLFSDEIPKRGKRQKFTDFELFEALREADNSPTKAAEILGVTRMAVIKRRNKLPKGVISPDINDFKSRRADIFAELQQILLQYVTPEKLKKASLQQIGTLFGIMYDKERLERNLATEFIAHAHIHKLSSEERKMLDDLSNKLTEQKLAAIEYND